VPARTVRPTVETTSVAPLRVTGTIRVAGGTPGGFENGAVTHLPDGLKLDGMLQGGGDFTIAASGPSTLAIDLTAYPTVDPRTVVPPRGKTWAEWAANDPTPPEERDALRQLVEAATEAARADDYAPYLGHHGPGSVRTTFHVTVAPPGVVRVAPPPMRPKAFPIALAGVAFLAVLANTTAIWRRL
jgi:hypothetical protein